MFLPCFRFSALSCSLLGDRLSGRLVPYGPGVAAIFEVSVFTIPESSVLFGASSRSSA